MKTLRRLPREPLSALAVIVLTSILAQASNDSLHLPKPTFPKVIKLQSEGHIANALTMLESQFKKTSDEPPLEALVLHATLLSELGRTQEAENLLADLINRKIWMRTFARRLLVQSLVSRDKPNIAETVLDKLIGSDAIRHLDLVIETADSYQLTGNTEQAIRLYNKVLAKQSRGILADKARLKLATALELSGDTVLALSILRETKLKHWLGETFRQAQYEEFRLATKSRHLLDPFSENQYLTLVQRLRNASKFDLALEMLEEWRTTHSSSTRLDRIEAEIITTLYTKRSNEKAVEASQRFYEQFPTSSLIPRIRVTDFRLSIRMTETERAKQLGLDLWKGRVAGTTAKQRRSVAELLAAYLIAIGDLTEGLSLYRELFKTSNSAVDQRAYLWRAGVASLRAGQNDRALTNLRSLNKRNPSGDLAPAALYWLGMAEEQARKEATAIQTFRSIVEQFPYHYYGVRAKEKLLLLTNRRNDENTNTTLEFPVLNVKQSSRDRAEYKAAMVLARAGLTKDAAWYFRRLLASHRRDHGLALLAARASAEAGNHTSASNIIVNHFGIFLQRPANNLPTDFWELVYPRPFIKSIEASASSYGINPILLFSLMRQESRFDHQARSPVGAIGLFQIMPYTAELLATSADVAEIVTKDGIDETMLTKPSINSMIAAKLTSNLLNEFNMSIAPTIASYNAGEKRVAIWWQAAHGLSNDFFVDTIPYSETRRFVREVLANYSAYQRVYNDPEK